MLSFNNKKRSVSIGVVLVGITLITTVYINSFANNYSIVKIRTQLHRSENHSHASSSLRVLCLILTSPSNFLTRTRAVNATWAPHCNRYFFVTEYIRETLTLEQLYFSENIPIAPIQNLIPGYDHLTQKSVSAFLFVYENYFNDFDWFVKADDDTYLIVEHLRMFLNEKNASEPVTFGYNFRATIIDFVFGGRFDRSYYSLFIPLTH